MVVTALFVLSSLFLLIFLALRLLMALSPPERKTFDTKRYTMHVVGENQEGRQAIVKRVRVGQKATLRRDQNNQYDRNAVAVVVDGVGQVGYLSRHNAEWVARIIDEGNALSASISKVFLDTWDGEEFLNLMIHVDGVPVSGGSADFGIAYVPPTPVERVQDLLEEASRKKTLAGQKRWVQKAIDLAANLQRGSMDDAQRQKLQELADLLKADMAESAAPEWGKKLMPQRAAKTEQVEGADCGAV